MLLVSSIFAALFLIIFINAAIMLVSGKYEIELKYYKLIPKSASVIVVLIISAVIAFILNYLKGSGKSIVELALSMILLWAMGVLTITDYKKKVVPNTILLIMLGLWALIISSSLFINIDTYMPMLIRYAIGGAIGGGMFLFSYLITKGQMGAGDVKLAFLIGLYLGSARILIVTLMGTVLCFVFSIIMVLLKRIGLKDSIPMVPFLAIGVWIILLIS